MDNMFYSFTHTHTHTHTYTHTHTHTYIYIYMCVCVWVCLCVCEISLLVPWYSRAYDTMLSDRCVSAFRTKVLSPFSDRRWDSSPELWKKKPAITHRRTPNGNKPSWKPQISLLHVLKKFRHLCAPPPPHYITRRHIPQHSSLANDCR